jgi:hypothetical protein
MSPLSPCILYHARQNVIDAPLTLMFRTLSQCCHNNGLPTMKGDSSIISPRCSETIWMFNEAMQTIIDAQF